MFLKPIPRYLLDSQFWQENLLEDEDLYENALGFLLSYAALVQCESDLYIAKDTHLIPDGLQWENWVDIMKKVLAHEKPRFNKRYIFGEQDGRYNTTHLTY